MRHLLRMARPHRRRMILRMSHCLATIGCGLLVSCYPYQENPRRRPPPRPIHKPAPVRQVPLQVTPPSSKVILPVAPEKPAASGGTRPRPATATPPAITPPTRTENSPQTRSDPRQETPPAKEKAPAVVNAEGPVAHPAPGKAGYVLSPSNNQKLILVRGIPSGTVVPDPASPDSNKKYFRVP